MAICQVTGAQQDGLRRTVARRSRRSRFAAGVSLGEIMPARLSEEADRAGTCHPERIVWPLRARGSRSFPVRSSGTA